MLLSLPMAFFFPAYFDKPLHISFCEQDSDENIELLLRQDWIKNVPWIFVSIILLFLPSIFFSIINQINLISISFIPQNIIMAALILWYTAIFAYVVQSFLYWYFNIYIITNKHLVDFDFLNLLSRKITEVRIEDIQSVESDSKGIIRGLFNFGNVIIETAAESEKNYFEDVPWPALVQERIENLQGKLLSQGGVKRVS